MKSLYRRYRPLSLEDVVGQEQVTKPLAAALKQGKISHAYLFIGPRGCGKTSVARILAHEVNGFKYDLEDNYVDIIEIDGASNRGIDNIRELREKVAIAPTTGKYKVYIIDEVHMLTKEAFNALLKTLEEPPAHAIFIMATTDAYKVPVTITSRAQTYTFTLCSADKMFEYLKDIAIKEKLKITDSALKIIAKRGGGSFRDSLSLLDQISTLSDKEIDDKLVIKALGLPDDEKITKLLGNYSSGDIIQITNSLKELLSSGVKPETIAEEIINTIVENPKPELLGLLAKLPDIKAPFADAKLLVALTSNVNTTTVSTATVVKHATNVSLKTEKKDETHVSSSTVAVSETSVSSKTEVKNETNVSPVPPAATNIDFDWDSYTNEVQSLNDAVYSQLVKTVHELSGDTLHIYPKKRIVKSILSRDNNKRILVDAAKGLVKITIHEVDETPVSANNDKTLSQISDIMGGEVINDGGESPF